MIEPTPVDPPAEPGRAAPEPEEDDPEVVLHAADEDSGELPWCIGDMTAL